MSAVRTPSTEDRSPGEQKELGEQLDAWGWGLFFVWVGISFMANLGWGLGLLGVGIITLGGQAARRMYGMRIEGFWTVLGLLFLVSGAWELMFASEFPFVPVALFLIGITFIWSAVTGSHVGKGRFSHGWGRPHH